jgi:2'-5' RNA ligase
MRTFVAVEISDQQVLDSIKMLQSSLKIVAKPVDVQNMHFTLMFLGEISDEMAQKIRTQLKTIEFTSFNMSFEGIGAFPKPKFPRVVWIGIDKVGASMLLSLAKTVEAKLAPFGFHSDKSFKPHATIFRIKNKIGDITDELARWSDVKFGVQKVTEFKLKKSVLTPSGPVYSDLEVILAK